MKEFIIPSTLGLDVEDFDVKIIEYGDYYFGAVLFRPQQNVKISVNESIIDITAAMEDLDFLKAWGYKQSVINKLKKERERGLKFEAVLKYVNTDKFVRKCKLEKISKVKNGNKS